MENIFKECPHCKTRWISRDEFLKDQELELIGYQADFIDLNEGLFLFNHKCKSTMAIKVSEFKDLYNGPLYTLRKTNSTECPRHCLHKYDLETCPVQCECAYVREIMQVLKSDFNLR